MWTCAGLLALVACACAVTRDQLYPHGPGLDLQLPRGKSYAGPEVFLKVPIAFYGESYESIFVNNHGVLSFRTNIAEFLNAEFPLPYPTIAAFYSNVDTTDVGRVFYRESNENHVLSKAEESVQNNFHESYDFRPTSVFIATWSDVTYSESNGEFKNTFQIAVISNGTESFVEFLYPDIQWIQRTTPPGSLPDAKAQAGFCSEDGRMFPLRGSGSHQIRNLVAWSNTHEPGKYVFRIGPISQDDNIASPEQYNQNEVEVEEESKTCAQSGPSVCHMQARCVDYQAGICCQCNEGFYGNGKSCVKDDTPLRVHGKLNGVVNDVSIDDVDIQAYVVVAEGRSYTALSQAPEALGSSLQLLNALGGVIGWLFAKPSGGASNGYQLTGSMFNHTADIYFPATQHRVTLAQEYIGHDVFDQISLDADVRGSLPQVQYGAKLQLSEYEEQYTLVRPGLLRSESTRTLTNKDTGVVYEQRISQTFTYNPCHFAPAQDDTVSSTLKVGKVYLAYEPKDNIVRYGMSNKIMPLGQEDPCIAGRSSCGPHSSCVVQGDSFKCVCESGFTDVYTSYQESAPTCADIDECSAGVHQCDSNADCYNHDGGYQCRCRLGFEGNGFSCNRLSLCANKTCNEYAQCVEYDGQAVCQCNAGYTGDGQRCWLINEFTCDVLHNCSPFATCNYTPVSNSHICQCNSGYVGDGYYCSEDTQPLPSSSEPPTTTSESESTPGTDEAEYNYRYVLPNCDAYNDCSCPDGYTIFRNEERNIDLCGLDKDEAPNPITNPDLNNDTSNLCNTDSDCPPNAICTASSEPVNGEYIYQCVCPEGYEGDSYECIEKTTPNCQCGPNANCYDTGAGVICVCNAGYHGDGYNCKPNSICTNDSDCEVHAECQLDTGSNEYICQCVKGYIKDQNEACILDLQLCNGAICAEHASCLYDETEEVRYCQCDPGFEGYGISACVPVGTSCNVANDCGENADCTQVDNSYQCVCREGFTGDGYSCAAERNCRNFPQLCNIYASCLKRSEGYVCECNSGYSGNGSHCELNPRQAGNFLVASDGLIVYRVPFTASVHDYATPINYGVDQIAVGLDIDCHAGKIYWGDVISNTIKSASYDGSGFQTFLPYGVRSPEGLAVDWAARNIFWTDSKKLTIEVANLDTKARKVLFAIDGISNPRGIAVHPQKGKVFWSDWDRNNPKIEWANMDGSQRGIFLDASEVKLPNSLAIDWVRDRLCYADAGLNSIKCVNIDTMEKEIIAANCSYPFGLAINGDKFYWTDWKTLKIEYVDTLTQVKGQVPIATASRRLYGVAVAPDLCPRATNVCQYRNGNCEIDQLCLPDGRGSRTCVTGDTSVTY